MVSVHRIPLYRIFSYLYSMYLPRLPLVVCLPNCWGELTLYFTLSRTHFVPSRYHLGTSIFSRLSTKLLSRYHLDSYRLWAPRPALKTRILTVVFRFQSVHRLSVVPEIWLVARKGNERPERRVQVLLAATNHVDWKPHLMCMLWMIDIRSSLPQATLWARRYPFSCLTMPSPSKAAKRSKDVMIAWVLHRS